MTIVVLGFRVVEPAPHHGKGKPKPLSKMFLVKAAAGQYVELARRAGHPTATLETIHGTDDCGWKP